MDCLICISFPEIYKTSATELENDADLPADPEAARKQAEAKSMRKQQQESGQHIQSKTGHVSKNPDFNSPENLGTISYV
jgi:hypothetical protein